MIIQNNAASIGHFGMDIYYCTHVCMIIILVKRGRCNDIVILGLYLYFTVIN